MKNTIGNAITVTLFGESHGEAIGAVIDGLSPGVKIEREYIEKKLSDSLETVIESRGMYVWRDGGERYSAIADGGSHYVSCAMPIISEGDVVGCVASLCDPSSDRSRDQGTTETESKLVMTAASFLGKQMES